MIELFQPDTRHDPSGYTHGVSVPCDSKFLFVSGQLPSDTTGKIISNHFSTQFIKCLDNVLAVVKAAGGEALSIVKLTIFITSFDNYHHQKDAISIGWKKRFGDYYPSISIIEVNQLIDPKGQVEIEALAQIEK